MRFGARAVPEIPLMEAPAKRLSPSDITAVGAYLAYLPR
jgi:hypothetical protein